MATTVNCEDVREPAVHGEPVIRRKEPILLKGHPGGSLSYLMNWMGYAAVVTGYLVSLLTASHLTFAGAFWLTAGNVLWLALYTIIVTGKVSDRWYLLLIAGLTAAAVLVVLASLLSGGLDWLLPVLMIGVISGIFPWRWSLFASLAMWLFTSAVIYLHDNPYAFTRLDGNRLQGPISLLPAFVFPFCFALIVRQHQLERERAETLLAQLNDAHRQLLAHASEAEDLAIAHERNRMAREIHDTLGHYLTVLAVQLETAIKLEERTDARLRDDLVEARGIVAKCLAEVRHSVAALRPTDLMATSLPEALRRLVAESEAQLPDTTVTLDIEGPVERLAPETHTALYRCAQEALTNIRKHAAASNVLVRLRVSPSLDDGAGHVELTVLDNGRGTDAGPQATDAHQRGFGLLGMRERIALLGGDVSSGAEPGRGWRVEVQIPLEASAFETRPGAALPVLVEG
ncbi:MAG TPA: sensor histidine kinase [Ktedonobacterales bacterium]